MRLLRFSPTVKKKTSVIRTALCSIFSASVLSGCVTTDPIGVGMLTGSMDATLALMAGSGNAVRTPDGKTNFTFVIHESATAYHEKDDLKGKEAHRLSRLGSWLSKAQECPKGYDVRKLDQKDPDLHVYEGLCK